MSKPAGSGEAPSSTRSATETLTVAARVREAPGVWTLRFCHPGGIPSYRAGQFITVYLPRSGAPEGRAYSLSSAPSEPTLDITVKAIGAFSRRLCAVRVGDTVAASKPLGYFYTESSTSALVMLAAGIGISPFRSVILDAAAKDPSRKLLLFHGNRTKADIIFGSRFDDLRTVHPNLSVTHCLTREAPDSRGMLRGRVTAGAVLRAVGDEPNPEFMICGSIPFVRDLRRDLTHAGIPGTSIFTEAFFSPGM